MKKKKQATALPNAKAIIDVLGMERVWHDLAMKLHKHIERPPSGSRHRYGGPYQVTFFNGLEDHFTKGSKVSLSYDFHARQFSAEIRTDTWKIREAEIAFHDLPKTILNGITGEDISRVVELPHLAGRTIESVVNRNTKRWRARLQMNKPVPISVEPKKT